MPPIDLNPNWATAPVFFLIILFRYLLVAGAFFWFFYHHKKVSWYSRKIQPRLPNKRIVRREILWSLATSGIMAIAGTLGLWAYVKGYTKIYLEIERYGWLYLFLSVGLMMALHEVYFYWTHRLLHLPWWFKHVHRVHHESVNPSPWAAFSFHPVEGMVQAVILPLIVLLVPVHPAALLIFLTIMTVTGVINHGGYEVYPRGLAGHRLGKYWITATHHYLHHRRTHCNYGLYVTLLDHWHRTEDSGYPELFEEVKARSFKSESAEPVKGFSSRSGDLPL